MSEAATDVRIDLQHGMRLKARNGNGVTVSLDAPASSGGESQGFSPMELLLVGLGGCTGMDVISILRKKRQDVTAYQISVHGKRSPDHPQVFTEIEIAHILRGNNLTESAVARSIELSETKYCPAYAMLSKAATITSRFEIHPAAPPD